MSSLFRKVFPTVTYLSTNAKRRLLQLPLVAFRIHSTSKNQSELYLMEKFEGFDYLKLANFLSKSLQELSSRHSITKDEVKNLFSLTQSDRERNCIRYAIFKASGVTQTEARRIFGFDNMNSRSAVVEDSIQEAKEIREAIENLAYCQDKALLDSYGIENSSSDSDDEDDVFIDPSMEATDSYMTNDSTLASILRKSNFNWFEFVENVEMSDDNLEGIFLKLTEFNFTQKEMELIVQSHRAYMISKPSYNQERQASIINGDIVSESESDNPEDYIGIKNVRNQRALLLVKKRRQTIKRRAKRLCSKQIAERRFLSKSISPRVSKIVQECPNIGDMIENFVSEHNVGADAWRRTGILTFDGNSKLKTKVTYAKIQKHLKEVYKRNFGYGTIIELCVARNKHRRSSQRYKGLAKVTSRRARKGFNLRYNPDAHWSAAFYKGLNQLQYEDGCNILNINRDDACGFRLDTLTTCNQYANPTVQGNEILTTRTDYVNRHPSVLQTTSYNFTGTKTTPEVCVGVVKAQPVHKKNPTQHFSDLVMLRTEDDFHTVFCNPQNGVDKPIDCIRVDGAADEGPSHELVQYWWTEWHVSQNKVATLVTSRSSGSSYLNRVELQNGCLSLGHSNTFIPSTLAGSCLDPQTGDICPTKLKENLDLAMDAYVSRVNNCPCGDTTIQLLKGSESQEYHSTSKQLEIFLKGSNKQKQLLQRENPQLFNKFERIWNIRNAHMVKGLPPAYVFFLKCCFKKECTHPICREQRGNEIKWYPYGPTISHIPLPVFDQSRPGHYKTEFIDTSDVQQLSKVELPPSTVLKQLFSTLPSTTFTEQFVEEAAKRVLLSPKEVGIWFNHLATIVENRRRGAVKAAATRQKKKAQQQLAQAAAHVQQPPVQTEPSPVQPPVQEPTSSQVQTEPSPVQEPTSSQVQTEPSPVQQPPVQEPTSSPVKEPLAQQWYCGTCGKMYIESSDSDIEFWIGCDLCTKWFCCSCEQLTVVPTSDFYFCTNCTSQNK